MLIGGVPLRRRRPRPAFASIGYLEQFSYVDSSRRRKLLPWALSQLRWMAQKDSLAQDMLLVGPPGPARRRLALAYAEASGREVEVIALTQDTSESDLKQRREISDGTLAFHDQAPVRAALDGKLLILDGLEKCERNVLPTLNNLLENREMALADGRFLTRADRYDQDATSSMVRVHPDFRVIALSLPVPRFPGFPLDPPLRSRFQARVVSTPPLKERAALLAEKYPQRNDADVASALKLGAALEALGCGGGSNPEGAEPLPLAHRDILFFPDSAADTSHLLHRLKILLRPLLAHFRLLFLGSETRKERERTRTLL